MSLIIATGTNIGDRIHNLKIAKELLASKFTIIAESKIYESPAVDYLSQPDFLNQVLEFEIPDISPVQLMSNILDWEKELGRKRNIEKGPRVIDIDILYIGEYISNSEHLQIPHPRILERSFVVKPLSELPYFQTLKRTINFPSKFENSAQPLA